MPLQLLFQTNSVHLYHRKQKHSSSLDRISCSSNYSSKQAIDGVPNEVKEKFKNLKEVAEGDAKPKRETTTQGVEQASILNGVVDSVFNFVLIQSCVKDVDLDQVFGWILAMLAV